MTKDNISDKDHRTALGMYNKVLGTPKDSSIKHNRIEGNILVSGGLYKENDKYKVSTRVYKPGEEIKLSSNDKLYHTSKVDGLTELSPTNKSIDDVHHSSKRVYFYKNTHGNRYGGHNTTDHVYELIEPPGVVHNDNELGGGAVYVDTDKPLKVRQIK